MARQRCDSTHLVTEEAHRACRRRPLQQPPPGQGEPYQCGGDRLQHQERLIGQKGQEEQGTDRPVAQPQERRLPVCLLYPDRIGRQPLLTTTVPPLLHHMQQAGKRVGDEGLRGDQ